jgi:hypothetical protein
VYTLYTPWCCLHAASSVHHAKCCHVLRQRGVLCPVHQGDLHVVYGTDFIGALEAGLRADAAIPHIAAQRRLQHLRLNGRALLLAQLPQCCSH